MAKTRAKKAETDRTPAAVDFVVITALDEERDAVLSKLRGARKLDKGISDVHTYYRATVRTSRQDRSTYQVIVTSLLNMGPINASAQAVTVVHRWNPRFVLLVGIACGVRGEVRHGDVLIASQVADYTLAKQQDSRRTVRWEVYPCGASLLDSANNIEAAWQNTIGVARPGTGKVERHKGVVASGGDVISDDQLIATYSESWPKLIGIEMEAGGVAAGIHQTTCRPEFLMIKAVSDFGKDKHAPEVTPWRQYACHAAAAFALSLMRSGPVRSFFEIQEDERTAHSEDERKRAADRHWQYIQSHPIRSIEILFMLKESVGFNWFRDVLNDTRLTFAKDQKSFHLGELITLSLPPNTKERSHTLGQPICSFWEIYEPERGYWFKKIAPIVHELSVVAGFDAIAPWSTLGIDSVKKLEDLALLTEIGVSIPARAYSVGVEDFALTFAGDTFAFSVRLSDHGLEFLHEMARVQHTVMKDKSVIPIGSNFSGVGLLDMFYSELLPGSRNRSRKRDVGVMLGLSGPDGRAISFYPTIPKSFMKSSESNEYSFKVTVPSKVDSASEIKKREKRLAASPTDAALYGELASLYLYEGRVKDAIKCLEDAIQKAPPSADILGLSGQTLRKVGRFEEALQQCEAALELAPNDARIRAEVGICLSELGRHEDALKHFEEAVRLEPLAARHHTNVCMAFLSVHRYSEAISAARRAADLEPENEKSALLVGTLLSHQGAGPDAERYLERAIDLAPTAAEAHEQLGRHFAVLGEHDKAVQRLKRAIEIEKSPDRYELLGASLAGLSKWPEAEEAFRSGLSLAPEDSNMRSNLGVALVHLGRTSEAAELFEEVLRRSPEDERTRGMLSELRGQ